MKNHIAPADCPPETGGRAKRRGWMRTDRNGDKANADQVSTPSPCGVVRTSYWRVRPSKGTEADLLLLLKTFFSPCRGRVAARWDVAKDSLHYNSQQPLSPPETGGVPVRGRGYDVSGKRKTENCHTPLRRFAPLSSVALGSAPLRGYRSTFSASSKDPLRPLS